MPSTSPPSVAVVDYGAGNLRSVAKALERSGFDTRVSSDVREIEQMDAIVLPGVGAFADAAASLRRTGLWDAVSRVIESGRPYLGLCLGLQLLFEESDEHGVHKGLGVLPGRVERFPKNDESGAPLLVPHIGWNEVRFEGQHPMLQHLPDGDTYYFVHSYRALAANDEDVIGRVDYGGRFAAAVARDNVVAVQFHPEKSQASGRRLLDGFRLWVEASR